MDRTEAESSRENSREISTSGSIQVPSELISVSVASLEKRLEHIEENSTRDATSVPARTERIKVPKELLVINYIIHTFAY